MSEEKRKAIASTFVIELVAHIVIIDKILTVINHYLCFTLSSRYFSKKEIENVRFCSCLDSKSNALVFISSCDLIVEILQLFFYTILPETKRVFAFNRFKIIVFHYNISMVSFCCSLPCKFVFFKISTVYDFVFDKHYFFFGVDQGPFVRSYLLKILRFF